MHETVENKGRLAVVTGGARGIGLGVAKHLAAAGFDLVITGRRGRGDVDDAIMALQRACCYPEQVVHYAAADVSSADARTELLRTIDKQFGRLDVLVNNAGIAPRVRADVLEATEESFDELISVNLKGPYFLTQAVARWMVQQQAAGSERRTIVNVSSVSATVASINRGDYCISKAGVAMATKLWASRLTQHGIGVFEVQPGVIATDMTAGVKSRYDALMDTDLLLEKRWGTPDDVGTAVAMLVCGKLPYAPGATLVLDGGMTLPRL